jgi:hypothetical protein
VRCKKRRSKERQAQKAEALKTPPRNEAKEQVKQVDCVEEKKKK